MLLITQSELAKLRSHSEQAYPEECCGVLLGRAQGQQILVSSVLPCRNAEEEQRATRYRIAPAELIRIQREAREQGVEIVGFYHSHPDQPARFSLSDIAAAYWVGCAYVVTAVQKGLAGKTRAFMLVEEGKPEEIQIIS